MSIEFSFIHFIGLGKGNFIYLKTWIWIFYLCHIKILVAYFFG